MPTPPTGIVAANEVTELLDGRSCTTSEDGTRSYVRVYAIDFRASDIAAVTGAVNTMEKSVEWNLPVVQYQSHPSYPAATLRTIDIKPEAGDLTKWCVTCNYSSARYSASGDGVTNTTPEQNNQNIAADARLPEYRQGGKKVTKPLETDVITFADVVNKAGDPFDPPLEKVRTHPTHTLSFYRLPSALGTRENARDKVNAASFTLPTGRVVPAGNLLVDDMQLEAVWDKASDGTQKFFWKITVVLEENVEGWNKRVLNAGKREKLSDGTLQVIRDATGQPISDPVPLSSTGGKLTAGASFVYLTFSANQTFDFGVLFG